jgi:putative aldouronate transport system substrate-binding protein
MLGAMPTEVRPFVALIRWDLAEKYGVTTINTFNDLYTYIKAIGTKEQGMTALMDVGAGIGDTARWFQGWSASFGWSGLGSANRRALTVDAAGTKVIVPVAQAQYLDYAGKQDELQRLGAISKSANSNKTNTQPAFQSGQTPIQISSSMEGQISQTLMQHPEFKLKIIDFSKDVKPLGRPINAATSGFVIHATTSHPERALMALDMLQGDKVVTQLLTYGVSGVHYQPVGDTKFRVLPGAEKLFPAEGTCPWGVTDSRYKLYNETTPQEWLNVIKNATARATGLPSDGFVFDESGVQNEIAAINNICATYGPLIDTGLSGDYKAKVAEFNEKLKQAGIDKVVAEAQKQLDKYIATNR